MSIENTAVVILIVETSVLTIILGAVLLFMHRVIRALTRWQEEWSGLFKRPSTWPSKLHISKEDREKTEELERRIAALEMDVVRGGVVGGAGGAGGHGGAGGPLGKRPTNGEPGGPPSDPDRAEYGAPGEPGEPGSTSGQGGAGGSGGAGGNATKGNRNSSGEEQ